MFLNKKKVLKTKLAVYIKLYNACDENLLLLKIVDIQYIILNKTYTVQFLPKIVKGIALFTRA